ncbi:MAG: hypothetical protein MI717_14515 [Spirochaetales bacterium]|nr:hypothetical protein [Spirochaetales bacterium]
MSADLEHDVRLMHMEDMLNRMNVVLADLVGRMDDAESALRSYSRRIRQIESALEGSSSPSISLSDLDGPSQRPPDGINR